MAKKAMGQEKLSFGVAGAFRVVLEWRDDYGSDGPIGRTWGALQLWVGDTLVWGELDSSGQIEGITWSWIELLEFLGNAWPYLVEEEQHPIIFDIRQDEPAHIGELWGRAKLRWLKLPEEQVDREDALLRDFLAVHDFAEALQGAHPPKLLILRRGGQILAATVRQERILSFDMTMSTLKDLGEAIKDRLAGLTDLRSEIARTRWANRDTMPTVQRLQIATGRDEPSLRRIWPIDVATNAANDALYELKAAARMIGQKVTDSQLKAILERVYNLPKGKHLALDDLHKKAADVITEHESQDPAAQGYLLASMLRAHLNCETGRVDPQQVLDTWGVSVQKFEINDLPLDAIAVWGAEHAPTILLNPAGPRTHHPTGTRSTLAHEICHLLVDMEGALPVAEVLGGNVPRAIEQRANAFAAEFLLPRAEARACVERDLQYVNTPTGRRDAIGITISGLVDTYGASHETTAWQILNSGCIDPSDKQLMQELQQHLKSIYDPFGTGIS